MTTPRIEHLAGPDGSHAVSIYNLRVLLSHVEGAWLAEGLDIDYVIDGTSQEDVSRRFEEGLAATIKTHVRVYGNIQKLIHPAPVDVWDRFVRAVPPDQIQANPSFSVSFLPESLKSSLRGFEKIIYATAA